jgi:hypothetical protein
MCMRWTTQRRVSPTPSTVTRRRQSRVIEPVPTATVATARRGASCSSHDNGWWERDDSKITPVTVSVNSSAWTSSHSSEGSHCQDPER